MIYLILFTVFLLLINAYFKIADHFNIIDKPNARSSHSAITIRGGGIIFINGALAYFILYRFQFPWFIEGLLLISFISLLDDIKTVSRSLRLTFQFAAVLLLFYQLNLFSFPWWTWIITMIITTGIINAYNFMDGINGITGGYSLAVLAGLWMANNYQYQFIDNQLIYFTGIALLVFNVYNFRRKARCFAGDVGSVSMAFILIFLLGKLILSSGNIMYLFFLTLYGIDSVLTILHRLYLKENIFEPHRKHFYQVLANEAKIPHVNISAGYTILQTLLNLFIIWMINSLSSKTQWMLICSIILMLSCTYLFFKKRYVNFGKKGTLSKQIL
jgi:UDP-N-acetylmuramyl pentapeptide phosphotransferase/UDP-N-acetylglucosamine-1-phosphate transferase